MCCRAPAAILLDEIVVMEPDGDGFLDLIDRSPLEMQIEFPAGNAAFIETPELMVEDWKAIRLNAYVNAISGSQVGVMTTNASYEISLYGSAPDGPELPVLSCLADFRGKRRAQGASHRLLDGRGEHSKEGLNWILNPAIERLLVKKSPINDRMFLM